MGLTLMTVKVVAWTKARRFQDFPLLIWRVWRAVRSAALFILGRNGVQKRRLDSMLAFLVISLTFSLSVTAKTTGCFDNKRFCFELTPSSSSLYLVSVQRKVELPVALTLYSNVMQDIPTGSK
jgi:hypothetical protein